MKKLILISIVLVWILALIILVIALTDLYPNTIFKEHRSSGYFGSICASDFGFIVPGISVQTVPVLFGCEKLISVRFVPQFDPAHRTALKDQVLITLSLKSMRYGQHT